MGIGQPTVGGGIPADDSYLVRRLEALEAVVKQFMAARTLEAATIGAGGLTITGGGSLELTTTDQVVLYVGNRDIPDGSGRTQQAFIVWRDDGTAALAMADLGTVMGHTHQQALVWFDRTGNTVFADDTTGGVGIASPYVPVGSFVDITTPTATTTSTSFQALQWADCFQQHPKVTASVLVSTPSGTTGQVRMTVGGVQIGLPVTIPSNSFGEFIVDPAVWPSGSYTFQSRVIVQLEAKTTAGAGAIGVRGLGLWGLQS